MDCDAPFAIDSPIATPFPTNLKIRKSRFYFDDEMTVFKAENTLFKIHRYFLIQESEFFNDLFSLPSGEKKSEEGTTDETAIFLPDVTSRQMELLLEHFYTSTRRDKKVWTIEDLKDLLSISSRFLFKDLRTTVIEQIDTVQPAESIPPIDKIMLARKYDVPHWIIPTYASLCTRDESISTVEATRLGIDLTMKLCRVREKVGPSNNCNSCRAQRNPNKSHVEKLVRQALSPDL
ncbi:hypothetical protein C8Q75DRAFT_777799 [Abortiporus biennis]|nr:hypothetical protein C8Q75DRAFT_777799 [Abortiporus biennis]